VSRLASLQRIKLQAGSWSAVLLSPAGKILGYGFDSTRTATFRTLLISFEASHWGNGSSLTQCHTLLVCVCVNPLWEHPTLHSVSLSVCESPVGTSHITRCQSACLWIPCGNISHYTLSVCVSVNPLWEHLTLHAVSLRVCESPVGTSHITRCQSACLWIPCGNIPHFFCNPILFAICTSTFRKLCKNVYSGM
jgi:hypothetical protein